MKNNYEQLIKNLQERRDPYRKDLDNFSESIINYKKAQTYVDLAMEPVSTNYTSNILEAGKKVEKHLQELYNCNFTHEKIDFKRQGSVITNTHIKGYSDIDIIVIYRNYFRSPKRENLEKKLHDKDSNTTSNDINKIRNFLNSTTTISSDTLNKKLQDIRLSTEKKLQSIYDECDINHPKAIKILHKSYNKNIDVVISCLYTSYDYIVYGSEYLEGVCVYDKEKHQPQPEDFPFISIHKIKKRDKETNGNLAKMIRFLKNIKSDYHNNAKHEDKLQLSSFDINAICYDIEVDKYRNANNIELVNIIYNQLCSLYSDASKRMSLKSVNGNESIFLESESDNNNKINSLYKILTEVSNIRADLEELIVKVN